MLSITKLEKITGHTPIIGRIGNETWAAVVCTCQGSHLCTGHARGEQKALRNLHNAVYDRHRAIVLDRDHWRCTECGEVKSLQVHHIKARSKGRDDRIENLRSVCCGGHGCHEREHGQRQRAPRAGQNERRWV